MLVRNGDGEWLPLEQLGALPPGGFRAICGSDAARLLDLDTPLFIAAFDPDFGDGARPDAIALTPDGDIALIVSSFGEAPADTLLRLVATAGALQGSELDAFTAGLTELHGAHVGEWVAQRAGGGDAGGIATRVAAGLTDGRFDLIAVTPAGPAELTAPLRYLHAGPGRVAVYELEIMAAGTVQAVEGNVVPIDGSAPARTKAHVATPEIVTPVAATPKPTLVAVPEPTPEPQTEAAVEVEVDVAEAPEAAHAEAVEAAATAEPVEAPEVAEAAEVAEAEAEAAPEAHTDGASAERHGDEERRSTKAAFLEAVDLLDHRTSRHMRMLAERFERLFWELTFMREGETEYLHAWTINNERSGLSVAAELDSTGALSLVLSELPPTQRRELSRELATLLPDGEAQSIYELEHAALSVTENLNDDTLLEYLGDNLGEAFTPPSADRTPAADAEAEASSAPQVDPNEDVGDDFFASVREYDQASDEAEAASRESDPAPADAPAAEAPKTDAAAEDTAPPAGRAPLREAQGKNRRFLGRKRGRRAA